MLARKHEPTNKGGANLAAGRHALHNRKTARQDVAEVFSLLSQLLEHSHPTQRHFSAKQSGEKDKNADFRPEPGKGTAHGLPGVTVSRVTAHDHTKLGLTVDIFAGNHPARMVESAPFSGKSTVEHTRTAPAQIPASARGNGSSIARTKHAGQRRGVPGQKTISGSPDFAKISVSARDNGSPAPEHSLSTTTGVSHPVVIQVSDPAQESPTFSLGRTPHQHGDPSRPRIVKTPDTGLPQVEMAVRKPPLTHSKGKYTRVRKNPRFYATSRATQAVGGHVDKTAHPTPAPKHENSEAHDMPVHDMPVKGNQAPGRAEVSIPTDNSPTISAAHKGAPETAIAVNMPFRPPARSLAPRQMHNNLGPSEWVEGKTQSATKLYDKTARQGHEAQPAIGPDPMTRVETPHEDDEKHETRADPTDFVQPVQVARHGVTAHLSPMGAPRIPHAHQQAILTQVTDTLIRTRGKSVDISLDPAELGKVRMSIHHSDTAIAVHVIADRPETLDLLRRNSALLQTELVQMGFQDVGFSFSRDNGSRNSPNTYPLSTEISEVVGATNAFKAGEPSTQPVPDKDTGHALDLRL